MTGYKATNADMTCKGHKFKLGEWYEVDGEIELYKRGFHFCVSPSGVYAYYDSTDVRVFTCEAEQVLECPTEAGADFNLVAKRIRLTAEITPGSKTKNNTGNRNTGDRNTGDLNTGDLNTGNWNTGDHCAGFFCSAEPKVLSFDVQTELTHAEFLDKYPESYKLGTLLALPGKIEFAQFKRIPGISPSKLDSLHKIYLSKLPKTKGE